VLCTDAQIDLGFVIAAFVCYDLLVHLPTADWSQVPMIVVLATGEDHLRAAWRICIGIGAIPPLSLLYLRFKLKEPEQYTRHKMTSYPWKLIIKFYWFRNTVISIIWFVYNFSAYSFGIFASSWLVFILPSDAPLWQSFGWACLTNFFWLPGAVLGAFMSDWIGAKNTLVLGVTLQGIVGFAMTAAYPHLNQPSQVGGFVVMYGIFLALGEVGPGANIGLMSSKLASTPIRGHFYG
jgi:MFS family permease